MPMYEYKIYSDRSLKKTDIRAINLSQKIGEKFPVSLELTFYKQFLTIGYKMKDFYFDDRSILIIELEYVDKQYIDQNLENEPFQNCSFYQEILSKKIREIYGEGRELKEVHKEHLEYLKQHKDERGFKELPAIPYTERQKRK